MKGKRHLPIGLNIDLIPSQVWLELEFKLLKGYDRSMLDDS